MQKAGDV